MGEELAYGIIAAQLFDQPKVAGKHKQVSPLRTVSDNKQHIHLLCFAS